jgi:hypothetical protein
MSVSINFKGRCGNNIFQYVTARIFAEKHGILLKTKLDCDIVKTKNNDSGYSFTGNRKIMTNKDFIDNELQFYGYDVEYFFDDYFQNCKYINNHIDLVKSFFDIPTINKNTNDIVLSIRLDDKVHSNNLKTPETWDLAEIIHPDYYKKILDSETYDNVFIVVDKIKYDWENQYMSNFDNYNPIIISKTPYEDFHFIRSFNKIVTSTSTYSYWAAFLSEADTIYTFKDAGFFGNPLKSHGSHIVDLWNIKNNAITIKEKFYFGI